MSTKMTVVHGEGVHFYEDCFDTDFLFLELRTGCQNCGGRCCRDCDTIAIPRYVWEVIRQTNPTDLSLATKTNKEIREIIEKEVDKNIVECAEAENPQLKALHKVWGHDKPREEQIKELLKTRLEQRKWQRAIIKKAQKLDAGKYKITLPVCF